jgi:multiple sugar transport system substrate-binding protein
MPHYTKRRVLTALAVGSTAIAAGCITGDDEEFEEENGENGDGEIPDDVESDLVTENRIGSEDASESISYWTLDGHSNQNTISESVAREFQELWIEWAEEHEDSVIEYDVFTDHGQYEDQIYVSVGEDTAADTANLDSFWVPNVYDSLEGLDEYVDDIDDFFPFVQDAAVEDGELKAAWYNTDCRMLYYHTGLIDEYGDSEPPATWAELFEIGQAIAENEDVEPYLYNGGRWEGTTNDHLALFWGQGGEILDDDRNPVFHEGDNYDYLLNVLEFFEQTIETGISPERVVNIDEYDLMDQEVGNENVAMFLGGSWQMADIVDQYGEEVADEWDVAPIPMLEEDMSATSTGGWTNGAFADDELAKEWASYYVDPDVMARICITGGYLPTRESVYDEYEEFDDDPVAQLALELLEEGGQARPGGDVYTAFSDGFQVAVGEVITGDRSPEEALDELIDSVID